LLCRGQKNLPTALQQKIEKTLLSAQIQFARQIIKQ
jgi:hypothetical protein